MKRTHFSLLSSMLVFAVLLATGLSPDASARDRSRTTDLFTTGPVENARLIIYRSPKLGANVPLAIRIDGQPAGGLLWGHTFDQYIAPGGRSLVAIPVGAPHRTWEGRLDLRPGHTYALIASSDGDYLVLRPTKPRTR